MLAVPDLQHPKEVKFQKNRFLFCNKTNTIDANIAFSQIFERVIMDNLWMAISMSIIQK